MTPAFPSDMLTLKTWFLMIGVVLCCLGFECFPRGYGGNPKRDLSLFNNFADLGTFIHTGAALFCGGMLVILLTLLVSGLVHLVRRITTPRLKKKVNCVL